MRRKKVKPNDNISDNIWIVVKVMLMQAIPLTIGVWVSHQVLNKTLDADSEVPKWIDFLISFLYSFKLTPFIAGFFILLSIFLLIKKSWVKSLKYNHLIINVIYVLFVALIINKIYSFMTLVYIFNFLPNQVPFIENPNISLLMIPACFLLACVFTYYYGKLMKFLKR